MPKWRVMLVDDDVDLCGALTDGLERHGYEVYAATSHEEALGVLREWPADVVVLDLSMAGRREDAFRGRPNLVLASGSSIAYLDDAAARLGAVAVLRKPFGLDALLSALAHTSSNSDGFPRQPLAGAP